jgi:hypothetical protein
LRISTIDVRESADAPEHATTEDSCMSYAVVWEEGGIVYVGRLDVSAGEVVLEGAGDSTGRHRRLRRADLKLPRIGRDGRSRLGGRPVLMLEDGGHHIRVACLDGPGALHELAERLGPPTSA